MNRKTHVLGVPFDVVTMDEAVARAEGLLKEKGQHFICTPNPEIVMEARKDAELMSILREADLVVPDGIGVVWASKYSEIRLQERVAGYDLRRLRRRDIPYLRRRIGIVFQDYQLLTDRNVFMNLYYVMKATGWKREDQIRERIDQVLKLVDLEAKSYKMPFELSGGEQQRLVIARALLNDPQVLLADEPTGNLDPVTAEGIMRLFQEIAGRGCAVVMSTHNTALIENYPARAILFAQGKIREVDLKAELG